MTMRDPNDPGLTSWVTVPAGSDFPIQNLAFGVFKSPAHSPRAAVRIGDYALDLSALAEAGLLPIDNAAEVFSKNTLNDFIALGQNVWRKTRLRVSELLCDSNNELKGNEELSVRALIPCSDIEMLLPVHVGDYTDFYSSIEHATNVGSMFRDPKNALLPNWKHLPVGYHGRSSSIVVSGTPIHRPKGQVRPNDDEPPQFSPTRLLDFELEMAFIVGTNTTLGSSIPIDSAEDSIFGLVLFNDLSARDIQKWEYVPLGPFLGKSFGSVVSPWIVTLDALNPFRVSGPTQDPPVLPYLASNGEHNFDINLEVAIRPDGSEEKIVCHSNFKYMYWSMAQQLAHQTVNGCNVRVGDMYASGTISGPTEDSYGSMLELSWRGTKPIPMPDGSERKFLLDNDTVTLRGHAEHDGVRIGFGEVSTKILPAL